MAGARTEPDWLLYARQFVGLKEIPGSEHNPLILSWLWRLKAWWRDDETPWCGTFVAHVMQKCELPMPQHWYRAKAWLEVGLVLDFPTVGCLVVFSRKGGGHIGFVVGQSTHGHLMVLGGNQGNKVSILPFDRARVIGYRWPDRRVLMLAGLPYVDSDGKVSANES